MLFASIYPGLGHVYLGDMKTAGSFAVGAAAGYGLGLRNLHNPASYPILVTTQNFSSYNVYAAYRDARMQPGMTGYSYKMPTDSLDDLLLAPFNPKILKKPMVWGGVTVSLGLAVALSYFANLSDLKIQPSNFIEIPSSAVAFPIGIGEESLFRGVVMPAFSEAMGPKGGLAASSIIFGAAHIMNAQMLPPYLRWRYYAFSIPFITGLGAYFGWITQQTGSLQEAVAVHSWYDFTLFSASAFASCLGASITGNNYSITIPF